MFVVAAAYVCLSVLILSVAGLSVVVICVVAVGNARRGFEEVIWAISLPPLGWQSFHILLFFVVYVVKDCSSNLGLI